jgi:hypothetical protein
MKYPCPDCPEYHDCFESNEQTECVKYQVWAEKVTEKSRLESSEQNR